MCMLTHASDAVHLQGWVVEIVDDTGVWKVVDQQDDVTFQGRRQVQEFQLLKPVEAAYSLRFRFVDGSEYLQMTSIVFN